jgi:hypothetical protein
MSRRLTTQTTSNPAANDVHFHLASRSVTGTSLSLFFTADATSARTSHFGPYLRPKQGYIVNEIKYTAFLKETGEK